MNDRIGIIMAAGIILFTVPIILNRLFGSRNKLDASYHGSENDHIYNFAAPTGIAIIGVK